MIFFLFILSLATASAADQVTLVMKNGGNRTGEIIFADDHQIRLKIALGEQGDATATVSIPRSAMNTIEFESDPAMEQLLGSPNPTHTEELDALWTKFNPWLGTPHSPTARIGCALGESLLASPNSKNAKRALGIFKEVETKAWSQSDRERAKVGRLQAVLASGNAGEAMREAKDLALNKENFTLLIQAKFIMAQARHKDFLRFLKENPRWNEDPIATPARHQLYDEVLELYLFPALFMGSEGESAARGLWGAVEIYRESGETPLAIETCRDITALYPDTAYASKAKDFLSQRTPEQIAVDKEKEAKEALTQPSSTPQPTASPSATPIDSDKNPQPKSTKKKKNGNQPAKN